MDKVIVQLTDNCRFHLGDIPDAWQAWYDDSDWEEVSLPHDWSVTRPFSKTCSSGTGYLEGGIGWYRIHITPAESWKGKCISITFDGVYKNSRVWCNSYYLGERPNGYISFTYDITHAISYETENIISVLVDHREIADSRWFTGSGITRKVTLQVEEQIHPMPDGIFFSTPNVSDQIASFRVENELINTGYDSAAIEITNELVDQAGHVAAKAVSTATIDAQASMVISASGELVNPKLWFPESPYLYTLRTTIHRMDNGLTYVADTKKVGVRSIHFDPDHGFFLNGKSYLFKGVCVHHDAGCLGAAVLPLVWKRRLEKLQEMGCNAIRMSHNPHMPELYELCDALGFFVIDEAFDEWEGPKNKWSTGHNVYPPKHQGYYVNFPVWHERDLVDLIRRDRNHPCVIMWSIGNEIDYPNDPYCHPSFQSMTGNNDANKPAAERQYNPLRPNAERLAILSKHLCDIVKKTDTTHPVTLAAAFPELSASLGFIDPLDVVGYNYKEHLYADSHVRFPDKPFVGSENGHSLSAWRAVTDNEYISGQFLWTGIDYLGEAHGWPIHGSGAGVLTLAGFEKPFYYRRQSFWATNPMIHLTTTHASKDEGEFTPVSECWNYPLDEEVLVKCYTNLPVIALYENDKLVSVFEKKEDCDCVEAKLFFKPGTLRAYGFDSVEKASDTGNALAEHAVYTTGQACQMKADVYPETCYGLSKKPLYQLTVAMLDASGHRVFHDTSMLHVSVENGKLLGIENGDLSDVTEYSASYRRAYRGQLMLYVSAEDCDRRVSVHLKSDMIKDLVITL